MLFVNSALARATAWLLLLIPCFAYGGDYEKAWEALHRNDKKQARELFAKAIEREPAHRDNALAALIILGAYEGNNKAFLDKYPNPLDVLATPDPYIYALWFSEGILGDYGKKKGKQLANLERIAGEARFNGSLHAAAAYYMGLHLFMSQQPGPAAAAHARIGALEEWQFAGPFDNICGSGFNKDYGPLQTPAAGKGFTSYYNTPVDWSGARRTTNQGWVFIGSAFPVNNALGYAQTFVQSPADQDAILCLGGSCALKVWVNDRLLIAEPEERITELDEYKVRCHLNKGYNRILVQAGFTEGNERPNFIVRLTDDRYEPLENISSSGRLQAYQRDNNTAAAEPLTHFAVAYFRQQMEKYPDDPMYPVLLCKTYVRNQEYDKAKTIMHRLYSRYTGNAVLLNEYINSLSNKYDKTEVAEMIERLKTLDPGNYWTLFLEEAELERSKKYTEALEVVNKMDALNGRNLLTLLKRVYLHANLQHMDSMVAALKETYARYPEEEQVIRVMYEYHKNVTKSPAEVLQLLETFLAKNYSYGIAQLLAEEYFERDQAPRGEALLRTLIAGSAYDADVYTPLVKHYFLRQQYDSAVHYLQQAHAVSPYRHSVLGDIATCYLQQNNRQQALEYFRKALSLYAGGYNYRQKIRELENKPEVASYFPGLDHYAEINRSLQQPKDTLKPYYYIFDEKNVVLYAQGAAEQEIHTALYINNKNGIDRWKEITVPYNSVYQEVTIVKAEVIKAGGAKVPAETYDNQVVFTRLEAGDAIYLNYRISSYGIGRLGREFWDRFYFSASSPTALARYNLLIEAPLTVQYQLLNGKGLKPAESRKENFRLYTWEMKDLPALKDETNMPNVNDIGQVLHVSTVRSWDVIAEWYSDITRMQSKEDFDLNTAYQEIFPAGAAELGDVEKAKRIYHYIQERISYSSVSFRQGAYVPQQASKTLITRLGDCKDLSALFVAFARKAGLDANLMLVSTRDNGQQGMLLPSMEFNHCIIRFRDGKDFRFLELTDNHLPFNAIPQKLVVAQVLNIPYNYVPGEKIQLLQPGNLATVVNSRQTTVLIRDTDQYITTRIQRSGEMASGLRSSYANKSRDELQEALQQSLSRQFRNPVTLERFTFSNLNGLQDTVSLEEVYTLKNDVINVGDMSMVKPVFMDQVATSDIFGKEARQYPFEYWTYENADQYNTEIAMELPEGKAFDQVPGNIQLQFRDMRYELTYEKKAPNKLLVKRTFTTRWNRSIEPAVFNEMKSFFNAILNAEQKYISFK